MRISVAFKKQKQQKNKYVPRHELLKKKNNKDKKNPTLTLVVAQVDELFSTIWYAIFPTN